MARPIGDTLVVSPKENGHGYGTGCRYLRMDTNEKNKAARMLYKKLGYEEIGIVPCKFNGIPGVQLVCLEKKL